MGTIGHADVVKSEFKIPGIFGAFLWKLCKEMD
jgi:hypothetical protein